MNIRFWQNKVPYVDQKLNLFILIFNYYWLYYLIAFSSKMIKGINNCDCMISGFGNWAVYVLVILLGLSFLCVRLVIKKNVRGWYFVVQATVFLILYGDYSKCFLKNVAPGLEANGAIIFWMLLTLSIIDIIEKERTFLLLKYLVVMMYFSSIFPKLLQHTFWGNGFTLQHYALLNYLKYNVQRAVPIALHHNLAVCLSMFVLLFEILSPLALLNKSFEKIFLCFSVSFHFGAYFFLNVKFMYPTIAVYSIYLADYLVDYYEGRKKPVPI